MSSLRRRVLHQHLRRALSAPGIRAYLEKQYEGKATTAADAFTYSLVRCQDCRLVYQAQVPDEQLLDEIYNHWVTGGQEGVDSITLAEYRYLAEQVQFVIEHFGVPPAGLRVLDYGFGWGEWAKMAMGFGCKVAGVDARERIRDAQRAGLEVIEGKDLPKSTFRFINTEQVFEHLLEPGAVLQELVASLTDDGIIKISVPDSSAALRHFRRKGAFAKLEANQQMPIAPLGQQGFNCFEYESLVAMGRKAGLAHSPPFSQMLNSASGLFHPRSFAKAMARPIYRHVFPRTTFVYFGRA